MSLALVTAIMKEKAKNPCISMFESSYTLKKEPQRSAQTIGSFADPILTANVYCSGKLDQVIYEAVSPFWREYRMHANEHSSYLWLVRYRKCGEHLKIRLHGNQDQKVSLQEKLSGAIKNFIGSLNEDKKEIDADPTGQNLPPIDVEDYATLDYPDRTLIWTEYRRSDVSLGSEPFLYDDHFVELLTRSLSEGCEIVMDDLQPDSSGALSFRGRQATLLKLVVKGLAALEFPTERLSAYLVYHRDWLVRWAVAKSKADTRKAQQISQRFDMQVETMKKMLEGLRTEVRKNWNSEGQVYRGGSEETKGWSESLVKLTTYAMKFCHLPEYNIDPFTQDQIFPRIFKALHGIGNQLGLNILNEAFAYHLLLRVANEQRNVTPPVRLIPA